MCIKILYINITVCFLLKINFSQTTFYVVLFYSFYGDCGHTAGEHVNRHDG